MFKIIKLINGGYFVLFRNDGFLTKSFDPLEAQRFIPNKQWYKEEELNEVKTELDNRKIKYKVLYLDYELYE